jgi:hypothetical protein
MIGIDFLKKDPTTTGSPAPHIVEHERTRRESDDWFVCQACATHIARRQWLLDDGSNTPLIFSNPHGHAFNLLLVARTEGMRHDQVFTLEHTWFAGYEWSIGLCRTCASHLGWQFRATHPGLARSEFAALSRDRVRLAGENCR